MNNFLILTPDGVGSTYIQRALTIFLNAAEFEYYNTHELLNGLGTTEDSNLVKDWSYGYSQTVPEICELLNNSTNNLVSRIAKYHVDNRVEMVNEDYKLLYKELNQKYNKILYCVRDPFEYALSWSIRNISGALNVYTINERIDKHGSDIDF